MPVRGGKVQKRVNEGGHNLNSDSRNSNLDLSLRHQYGLLSTAGLDSTPSMEELAELEALLEREQELLGQHHQISLPDINLLRSPDRSLRPPIELPHRRGHTPRTIPRTHGNNSVPLNQLSSIIFSMGFSDAEEDHQGSRRDGRERTNSSGNDGGGNSDRERSTSRSRTESGVSNASTVSLTSPPAVPPPPPPPINGELAGPSSSSAGASSSASAQGTASSTISKEDLATKLLDMKSCTLMARGLMRRIEAGRGVDSKRIMEKLQQIQGYIQQTTTAMAALEQQGDLGNIGQYNTLVKVMRDLKDSEEKLQGHLGDALKREGKKELVTNGLQNEVPAPSPPENGVEERAPANSESSGNQIVGIVRPGNLQGLSMQERLAASQIESSAIVTHMRESIARREDLMTRYKATQERLKNLKKQREDMRQEQRQLQGSATLADDAEDPSEEDPVPGAESWSNEDIAKSVTEFQTLFEKVDRIQDMYTLKAESIEPNDEEAQAQVANKIKQVQEKRKQLITALTKLRRIQRQRESGEQTDAGDTPGNSQPNSTAASGSNSVETPAESIGNHRSVGNTDPMSERALALASGSQLSNGDNEDTVDLGAGLGQAMSRVGLISDEVSSKRNELANLQKQFQDMKKLLDVTTAARKEDERRMIASQKRLEEAEVLVAERRRMRAALDQAEALAEEDEEEESAGIEVVGVTGRRIHLSEIERQNPDVMSKYEDLARAKERLAKMEEVMAMISSAKKNRQDVREVLPPEYLNLLEDAELEYPEGNRARRQPSVIEEESEDDIRSSRRYQRSGRRGSASRGEGPSSLGRNERDPYTREQESREISAMQKRLNKTTSRVSSVNEGSRSGHEKGAVKKQPQALWQERSPNIDPRMTEVMALQEELKQKKNALEALMRRMGKSSSLNMDNISDNISDNVSDNGSDRGDGGTTATWGTGGLPDYEDNHFHHSSEDELVDADETEMRLRSMRRTQPPAVASIPKDRNRYSGSSRHRRRQDGGHISVNNLATAPATRPKHNRFRGSSVPKASWETVPSMDERNFKSPSNTTLQAQQSIGAALSQLSQVQGTINNLHETLRHEQTHMMPTANLHGQVVPQMIPELPTPTLPASSVPHMPGVGVQPLTPMTAYAGLGSLSLGNNDPNGSQMAGLLQQCFSQLQLHSLEIQALSKHLQLLDRRDVGALPPISDSGGGGLIGRGGGGRRSEEEEEEEDQEEDEDMAPGAHPPSYALHHNLLGAQLSQDDREGAPPQVHMSHSLPVYLSQAGEESHPTGVTNPIYGRLGDLRDQPRSWGSHDHTSGVEQTPEPMAGLIGPSGVMESNPHPLLHLDRLSEERPQSQPQGPEDHHWASLSSSHPLHHQTTDLLNNQVPPGTRANNYWDNFRSYSRQNLLSTATKSNTSEHRPSSCTSAAGASGVVTRHQSGEVEDKRFNVSVSHINNSRGGTSGARARVSNPRINNSKGARVRNPVSNRHQVQGQNKHKTNNRMKQGDWYSQGSSSSNIPGGGTSNGPQVPTAGISVDRSLVNYNATRANSSDSDGGLGSVTLEVLREAEALMRCHANQPEFLLQLFRHASQITVHTDQHVAVALLQDLAARPHSGNMGINNQGSNNESGSLSLPAPLRESSWRRSGCRSHRNVLPQVNGNVGGLSGSEVSDSGLTSDDEDSRAMYRNVKNLSLSPGGTQSGMPGAVPWVSGANNGTHPRPQYPPSPQQQCHHPFPHHNYQYFPQHNLSNNQGGSRSVANSESSIYDRLVYNESHHSNEHPQETDEHWLNQENTEHRVRKSQNEPDTAGSSPEHAPHVTHPLSNDTEFLSFESLVSCAVRASVELLQAHSGLTVSPLLLSAIHNTVVGQVQTQSQSLNLPQSFLYSVDNELKSSLQVFVGKRLMEVSNEVPSVISQVLLTQYCTVLVQRLRDNPALPQTPTKLPQSKQTQMSNTSGDSATSTSSVAHSRHTQEITTATQTESSVFSIAPHHQQSGLGGSSDSVQRSGYPTSEPMSMISMASAIFSVNSSLPSHSSSSHPSVQSNAHSSSPHPPPPPPHITNSLFQPSSSSGQCQAPFSVPVHSPNAPSTLSESSHDIAVGNIPTSQPEAWVASSLMGQMTDSPRSLSRPESRSTSTANPPNSGIASQEWAEPEHEEAVLDDEPLLPVYDLAEADQSQDAGDAAEGDWEDSQAEGIQADGASGTTDQSPEHPIRLQADVEGMAECEADAAEVSSRGAMVHLLYSDHLVQGTARELGLDEVPTKLQSPDGGSSGGTPEHHSGTPQGHHSSTPEGQHHPPPPTGQPLHSPGGEG